MENSFKDFFSLIKKGNSSNNLMLPEQKEEIVNSLALSEQTVLKIQQVLPHDIKSDIGLVKLKLNEISDTAQSDAFISEISTDIGVPRENESKDEFVERGLKIIRENLLNHMKNKK